MRQGCSSHRNREIARWVVNAVLGRRDRAAPRAELRRDIREEIHGREARRHGPARRVDHLEKHGERVQDAIQNDSATF